MVEAFILGGESPREIRLIYRKTNRNAQDRANRWKVPHELPVTISSSAEEQPLVPDENPGVWISLYRDWTQRGHFIQDKLLYDPQVKIVLL